MIKLIRLCGDVFADEKRALEDLSAGLRDHFTRLKAYPHGGVFDEVITATRDVVERWNKTELAINAGQNTQQEGRDVTAADREKALNRLRRNYAALDALEDENQRTKLLQLLYPRNLEQYTDAKIDALDPLLEAYLKLLTQVPAAELPPGFAARTTADFGAFDTARDSQIEEQATTTRAREQRKAMVPEVTDLLTDNYHFLCLHFRKERGQVLGFFNRRYFEEDAPATDAPAVAPAVAP
ncbi:MAG: hypothetical protein H7330_07450 [Hymenobacteraceae bacterium]|nr:hypothetical protein [Hymenobacteraceae bacterium]